MNDDYVPVEITKVLMQFYGGTYVPPVTNTTDANPDESSVSHYEIDALRTTLSLCRRTYNGLPDKHPGPDRTIRPYKEQLGDAIPVLERLLHSTSNYLY